MSDWSEDDIPDQTGRIYLITGANSGIGFEAARALAEKGATLVLGCRNRSKADDAVALIAERGPTGTTEVLEMDLADLDSVESAANEFRSRHDRLDVLVNNAGLMATPRQETAQGFEMQIGVNHLGHFALTGHLLPLLLDSGPSRVVSISSQGHRMGRLDLDDLNSERGYSPWPAYFQSKLANLLFTRELQRRLSESGEEAIAVAAHPGVTSTNLGHERSGGVLSVVMAFGRPVFDQLFAQSAAMGALPTLRAATDNAVAAGDYFGPAGLSEMRGHPVAVGSSGRARNDADARRLWEMSSELTGVAYPI